MDFMKIVNIISSFILVLGLIFGLAILLRSKKELILNFFNAHRNKNNNDPDSIKIIDSKTIDVKTKIALFEIDGSKSAVIIGDTYATQIHLDKTNSKVKKEPKTIDSKITEIGHAKSKERK